MREEPNSYLEELEDRNKGFTSIHPKMVAVAKNPVPTEVRFNQIIAQSLLVSPARKMGGAKKLRFFNHKESDEFKSVENMGQGNANLKRQLLALKRDIRKSVHGSVLQLQDLDELRSFTSLRRSVDNGSNASVSIADMLRQKRQEIKGIIKHKNNESSLDIPLRKNNL